MFGTLIRLVLIVVVVVAVVFFAAGYWSSGMFRAEPVAGVDTPDVDRSDIDRPNIDVPDIDTARVRQTGAEISDRAAVAAARVGETLEEGSLTAKIKAKMVLDDLVKARAINVTTDDSVVTLTGTVHSVEERDRAVALARETEGVSRVNDQLNVR